MRTQLLLDRLDEIGRSLARSGHALALIGLGSVGLETERLDAYSDLDFFAIVEPGYKCQYLEDLGWLENIAPVAYRFMNTVDGYKLLFADGIFCEFAVFEADELKSIPFAPGRIVWKQPHVEDSIGRPEKKGSTPQKHDEEWLLGEALTNLYVGMAREKRGERLSAMRFIQGYAVDRLLELVEKSEEAQPSLRDEFSLERRFEQRHPAFIRHLADWIQGYGWNSESALAILGYLEEHFSVNKPMAEAIRSLCK